jgi:hypothetical protein
VSPPGYRQADLGVSEVGMGARLSPPKFDGTGRYDRILRRNKSETALM